MLIPQILAAMTGTLCILIDNLMIGQLLGDRELSAYGLSAPLIIVIASLGLMMANGVQVVCSKAIGGGDLDDANSCYSTSIAMSVLAGTVIIIIILAFCDPLCYILGAGSSDGNTPVFAQTSGYIRGYVLGTIFMFLYCLTGPYLQAMGKRKILMASVITVIISDLVLNYVFAAVLHMRMFGIGIASSLSCLLAVLVCLGYFFSRDCPFHFSFRGISREKAADIIRNGSPVIISQVLYVLRVFCFNLILLSLAGNDAVAAFSVVNSIVNLLYCIGLGAGGVTLMLSSLLYNENDKKQLKDFLSDIIRYTLTIAVAVVVIIELTSARIASLFFSYGSGPYGMALVRIILFSAAIIPACINALFKNYFQGIGHIQLNYLISLLESVALPVPLALFCGRPFGFSGVCIGYLLAQLLSFGVISVIVWKKYGRVSFSVDAYCYLDREFGLDSDDYRDFAVYNTEDAVEASAGAARFMKEKGMDSRLCFTTALCIEEVCMNTVKYGFGDGSMGHHAEVRVIISGDQYIVRFRDDCLAFDPTKYLELHNDNEPASHIGIRTMMAFSKEAIYINSLGLNYLTLKM